MTFIAGFVAGMLAAGGVVAGAGLVCYLLHRSHENFRKMFHAHPKDK